jgi:hypothetical protein
LTRDAPSLSFSRMNQRYSVEQILVLLQSAVRDAPSYWGERLTEDDLKWLGRVAALLEASGNGRAALEFRIQRDFIGTLMESRAKMMQPLYDVLSELELNAPAALKGAFIPPGDTWNGYAALVKIVQTDCRSVLIVDPYVIADIFMELVPHAVAKESVQILTAKHRERHPALLAAAQKWRATNPSAPPSQVRYAPEGSLHDRLIILDGKEVWLVSQSIKDIAKKSAASVTRAEAEVATWKSDHYANVWSSSSPIS